MPNPFATVLTGQEPPDLAPATGIGAGLNNTLRMLGLPGKMREEEYAAMERGHVRSAQEAAGQSERQATADLMILAQRTRERMPGVPAPALFKAIVASPEFAQNAMRIPADRMQRVIGDLVGSLTPEAQKPITVAEGGALVDQTGKLLFKNEKTAEASPRTKAEQAEIAKKSVASLGKVVEAGHQARMDALAIEQLDKLGDKIETGGAAAIRGYLSRVGVDLGDASDIQAFESLIDRLTPAQRQGLPGAASDRDVAMFKSALPSLIRQPGGNKTIIATMRAMVQDKTARADIAESVFTGERTVPEALRAMRDLPSPLKRFQESDEGKRMLKGEEPKLAPNATERPKVRLRYNPKTNQLEPAP